MVENGCGKGIAGAVAGGDVNVLCSRDVLAVASIGPGERVGAVDDQLDVV